jgi:Rrf2 family protein
VLYYPGTGSGLLTGSNMLTLTRKTDYALIALTHLAQAQDHCVCAREIAEKYGLPLPLLMNLLKQLAQRGLTRSVRGPRGGYVLGSPPSQITLHDVIVAVEGPVQLVQCVDGCSDEPQAESEEPCDLESSCPVRSPIHRIHHRLVQFLATVTLAEIAENSCCRGRADALSNETELLHIAGTKAVETARGQNHMNSEPDSVSPVV